MIRSIGTIFLAILMAFAFLISGITINFLQVLIYVSLYNRNRNLYRKLNYYLIYTSWAQVVTVFEWWSCSRINLYGDEEALRYFGKEHGLVVMNHKYDVDWLATWFTCDKLGMLGNAKACAKKSLGKIPIIGWGWIFAEMIFLERNWEKDKLVLGKSLNDLVEYEDPIMILYFCEGTRFTPEKYKASMEFAKSRNIPQLKHHLCPRTTGFNFSVTHLKDKIPALYCLQLGFPEGPVKVSFSNMLRGHSFIGDCHVRRIPMSEIPTDSDKATSEWLYQLYQEKDKLTDDYLKTNKFPGRCIKLQRSYYTLLNSLFWAIVSGLPFMYFVFKLLTLGSLWVTSITVSVIVLLSASMYLMVRATKSSKGSSYGTDKTPDKSSKNSVNNDASSSQADNSQNPQKGDVRERISSEKNHEKQSKTLQ